LKVCSVGLLPSRQFYIPVGGFQSRMSFNNYYPHFGCVY